MKQEQRHLAILELLRQQKFLTIPMLQQHLGVSQATIYRDVGMLENQQKVYLSKGKVSQVRQPGFLHTDAPYYDKMQNNIEEKRRIAKYAQRMIKAGMTVFLDSSTTVYQMCSHIRKVRDIKIVTNDVKIAASLHAVPNLSVFVMSGFLRTNYYTVIPHTIDAILEHTNIDVGFFSCDAFTVKQGCMITNAEEVAIKQQMMTLSKHRVLLCDHSKLNRTAFISFAGHSDLDLIITGRETPELIYEQISGSITVPIMRV